MNTVNTKHALIISHLSTEYVMAGIVFCTEELNLSIRTRTPFGSTSESEQCGHTSIFFTNLPVVQK